MKKQNSFKPYNYVVSLVDITYLSQEVHTPLQVYLAAIIRSLTILDNIGIYRRFPQLPTQQEENKEVCNSFLAIEGRKGNGSWATFDYFP